MNTTQQPIQLGVNIDHVATLRQARGTRYPDPVHAALMAEHAGADAITVHLREDRRHIQERDVRLLLETIQTRMNLELAATDEMVAFATQARPSDCCLVPERRDELTTEGGLNVLAQLSSLSKVCDRLMAAGIRLSLFVDAEEKQIQACAQLGVQAIELHTGGYANAATRAQRSEELIRLKRAAEQAAALGLTVHAGHGLHYHNVSPVAAITEVVELNIGHAIVAQAIFDGLAQAVREMKRLMLAARPMP
ncbi:MAG: pyridoxine 5'-phosphate synthase [Pseudomonadota bacterium]|nr:pyridoxine 5'-phosphate synthase [Pseudomonadota bacterium]